MGLTPRDAQWAGSDELIYRSQDDILSVSLSVDGDILKPALPQPLFELPMPQGSLRFRGAPDGQRILIARNSEVTPARRDPIVVINWIKELEEKVPASKLSTESERAFTSVLGSPEPTSSSSFTREQHISATS